jgi:hypothetical protein
MCPILDGSCCVLRFRQLQRDCYLSVCLSVYLSIYLSVYLSIYGSTALCWALDAFQFLDPLHSR